MWNMSNGRLQNKKLLFGGQYNGIHRRFSASQKIALWQTGPDVFPLGMNSCSVVFTFHEMAFKLLPKYGCEFVGNGCLFAARGFVWALSISVVAV